MFSDSIVKVEENIEEWQGASCSLDSSPNVETAENILEIMARGAGTSTVQMEDEMKQEVGEEVVVVSR